jgi:hypothetical protein
MTRNLAEPNGGKLLEGIRELANLRDEAVSIERFARRWPHIAEQPQSFPQGFSIGRKGTTLPKSLEYVIGLRNYVREIWTGGPDANALLTAFFLTSSPITDLIRPNSTSNNSVSIPSFPLAPVGKFEADWRRGGLVYRPETELQEALYLMLQCSNRAKVCANPDCPAPYFIAKKPRELYCSTECVKPFQRKWKRDWWKRVGSKRRAKRKRKHHIPVS